MRHTLLDYGGSLLQNLDQSGHLDELNTSEQGMLAAVSGLSESTGPPLTVQGRREARETLMGCVKATMPKYVESWHHTMLAAVLDKVRTGEIKRLLVEIPPRHGKTQLVSRHFPAYLLGKNPDEQIIGCSYSASLASSINRDVQRIMMTPEYQYSFPDSRLNETNVVTVAKGEKLRNSNIFEMVDYDGYYIAAGIGGSITGRGFTVGIVDDPVKNRKEANSKVHRDAVWEWWTSTFLTRGEGAMAMGGEERIIVTLTRWHEDDLAGRLLRQAKETGEEWTVIRLPAVLDEDAQDFDPRSHGDALWPYKYDEAKLERIKKAIGSRDWNALYQNRPAPIEGGLFKRHWWRWYEGKPSAVFSAHTITMDAAFKDLDTSSYVVIQVWGHCGADEYLLDQTRARLTFLESCTALVRMCEKWPQVDTKLIEDKANGTAIINTLNRKIGGLVPRSPKDSKESRAQAVVGRAEAGNIFLPRGAPWVEDFVEECAVFPNGLHDDQVDAMVQYLLEYGQDPVAFLEALTALE
jgi:predicted phage terminase large subunit-like protein